jgi:hypothetical protein
VNLSPARLVVLVVLVVGGLAILLNGFGDGDDVLAGGGATGSAAPTQPASPSPGGASPAESPSETPAAGLEPVVDGVTIQVLNGTDAVGLAAQVQEFLVGKGYVADLDPGDVASKPVATTTVYFRPGADAEQNEVNAQNMADRYLSKKGVEAEVSRLDPAVTPEIDPQTELVVVLGDDYAAANPV